MTDLPTISIVTPSYNQEPYIVDTVRSVLLQRYPKLEYIVMDGGSTDGTVAALAPYIPRFAHFQSARDGGQAAAVADGFSRSTGQIMAYLNSDDLLAPGTLHYVADYFRRHPEVDAIYSHRCTLLADNRCTSYWILPRHRNYLMMRWDLIPQETCFWRRSLWEKAGNVDPKFRFALDYDLFCRFMQAGKFVRVNRFLGAFRFHEDAKTTRLLAEVGFGEIKAVRTKYGVETGRWTDKIGSAFSLWVQRAAAKHAALKRILPGQLPGTSWNYNELWGGQLSDPRLPPA